MSVLFEAAGLRVCVVEGARLSFEAAPNGDACLTEAEARELTRVVRNWLTVRETGERKLYTPPTLRTLDPSDPKAVALRESLARDKEDP